MDLKALLLNSISSKRPLVFNRRMHIGKNCYAVTFEVKGKILTVTRIRPIYSKAPTQKRIQQRFKFLQKLRSCSSLGGGGGKESVKKVQNPLTPPAEPYIPLLPEFADCATQTSRPQMRSRMTETEWHVFTEHRQQQTIRRALRKQGTQTQPNYISQATQTEPPSITTSGTQTIGSTTETASSQTESYCCSKQVQTDEAPQASNRVEMEKEGLENLYLGGDNEKDAVVFMLNEIGEMIITQNHLLQNNSTMLSQISEMTMLSKVVAQQQQSSQQLAKQQQYKMHRLSRKRGKLRFITLKTKEPPLVDRRSQWTQTTYPIGLSSKGTQTCQQPQQRRRRFRLFCF